ncbi:MAG: glycosyltransferase family 4 protein [Phycisphaeraceae bacterium]|nr:glycosyltransferase family 4 protein [Phycisphaeraceae bacterium]
MIHYITTNGIGNAWVANELKYVLAADIPVQLHAMRRPRATFHASDWAGQLDARTQAIYPLPPAGLLLSVLLAPLLFGPRFFAALANAIFGHRENFRARVAALAHFFVACHWARRIRNQPISLIHSQWIHSGGTIGMYGAWLLNKPFSFTGHAADLFRDRVALRDKIRRAAMIVCISEFHRQFYLQNGADPNKLFIVYCGIDVSHFTPPAEGVTRSAGDRSHVIASGRLVEKKGFVHLIDAMDVLRQRGVSVRCTIAGNGPLEDSLRRRIADKQLGDFVRMTGKAIKQEEIPAFMRQGDVYALPCVWASDNDVDGLPQMLMEAMACGCPVISTKLVGIPDLILDGRTGLLVEPHDVEQLADAIQHMLADRDMTRRMALAGRQRVLDAFNLDTCLEPLIRHYRSYLSPSACSTDCCGKTQVIPKSTPNLEAAVRP